MPDLDTMGPETLKNYCQEKSQSNRDLDPVPTQNHDLAVYLATLTHKNPALKVLEIVPTSTENVSGLILWNLLHREHTAGDFWEESFDSYNMVLPGETVSEQLIAAVEAMAHDKRIGVGTIHDLVALNSGRKTQQAESEETYDLVVMVSEADAESAAVQRTARLVRPGGRLMIVGSRGDTSSTELHPPESWLRNLKSQGRTIELELTISYDGSDAVRQDWHCATIFRIKEVQFRAKLSTGQL